MRLPSDSVTAVRAQAPGPLFVISMWRSGSSLLYALLNKHPQVGLMYEADLMLLRPTFLKPGGFCDWAQRWQFWDKVFTRHGLNAEDFRHGFSDFPSAFAAVHKEYARRKGATIWGDKSPNYYDRLQEMAETFPDAKFIIVWRDPSGTANSILRAGRSGNHYFKRKGATLRALIGYGEFKKQCDWLVAHGKPVYQLSYEDLTADTPRIMREVCKFLQIPYSDDLADLKGADRSAIFGGEHHAFVKGDKIVAGPRPSIVADDLRNKIAQYVAFWRARYAGVWPPFPQEAAHPVPAGLITRILDRLAYRRIRAKDFITRVCFSLVPLPLLQAFRDRKYRGQSASSSISKPQPPADLGSPSKQIAAKEI